MHGTMLLQTGQYIIMADKMDQAGALQPDVTTTLADYGDEQVNREQTTGAGHKGVASATQYHNGRQTTGAGQVGIASGTWYHNDRHD
jgi:hypothetical protein